ncbi:MAG: FAD:protein FMN transferase [Gammaproteobacteria bacterium]
MGLLVALTAFPAGAKWYTADDTIMGTTIHVELWHENEREGERLTELARNELRRIDAAMSPHKPGSDIYRLNREAAAGPVAVSGELIDLVERALDLSRITAGAFDITFASAGYAYDYRMAVRPSDNQLRSLRPNIDYRYVMVDRDRALIRFARSGVKVDLGGIAKGYAVERSIRLLRDQGVRHALVSAGGDTRVLGDRNGRPWIVGIRHPRSKGKLVTRLPLVDEAVSTSGDYERFFEDQGVRYHHIINPETGDSARGVQSVTIIGPDATMTDGLSTGVFVLGAERGLNLINRLPGYEAVIIDGHGDLHYSDGLESR